MAVVMTVPPEVWARLESKELLGKYAVLPTQGIDLDNEVNTLFARERFSDGIDYEALLPALRLATRLIRSEASLIFYHTIFHEKVERRHYPSGSGLEKERYEVVHPPESLTKKQRERVKEELGALANFVTYKHSLTDSRFLAVTRPADGDADLSGACKDACKGACKDFRGLPSTILFGGELYTDIVSNFRNHPGVTEKLVYDHIKFANVMCHELAHAAGIFRWGNDNHELTIGDNVMAESGFDWETAVWGGRLDLGRHVPDRLAKPQYSDDVPTHKITNIHMRVDTPYFWKPTLDETDPLECVPKGYALVRTGWMVPERLMHKFQEPRIMGRGLIDPAQLTSP
ncbi:hypothetical protein LTR56_009992 [Elasticomyces elasticus]|nr:hypothetical protein LTR56_009992 [Elasticomyces elasticus]KAK3665071.1 hypothetical protein LTR22_004127 [Elasticomyces elasticus]